MSFIDGTAVNVALPVLQRDLHASAASVQWVVEGYSLFLSALILIGGSLGDLFGRRLVFGSGIALFALASLACAIAPNIDLLIAARCLQGVGGALAVPGSLALISATYADADRGRAIGTWSGFSAITAAIGPVLGGALVQFGSWRWVFVINVPLALAVLVILRFGTSESRDDGASRSIDVAGASLATFGLGALVYGLIGLQGGTLAAAGFSAVALGAVALAGFVLVEARTAHPMVRLELFASRRFSLANLYTFLLYAALGGSVFFVPFDLINVQGYPPAAAGAALLPMVVIVFAFSRFSGGLVATIGARLPLVLGSVLAATGFVIFGFSGVGHSYWLTFFPGATALGLGAACFAAPITTTVMGAVEPSHAGVASGINNAVARTAGLIAIAALGIALAGVFEKSLGHALAREQISGASRAIVTQERAQIVAGQVPTEISSAHDRAVVGRAIHASYARGFQIAMFASALLALLSAPIALDRSFRRDASSR
ncbi:MAG: MFS transporter [Candidatus Eremiobacteraeota bacterium]|nr:MFS transporter [Candidatus Eremiobacteraeota bacterium]